MAIAQEFQDSINGEGDHLVHLEVMSDTSLMGNFYGKPKGYINPIELLPFYEKK